MDRQDFDYENDLKYDRSIFLENCNNFPKECKDKALKIIQFRQRNMGMTQLRLAYGNLHEILEIDEDNKHKWTAFVTVRKSDDKVKTIFDTMKEDANIAAFIGMDEEIKKRQEERQKIMDCNELKPEMIIKKVVYHLHPTFSPSVVYVDENPYQIVRYGWGAFNVCMTVEFHDHLKMENIQIDHFLSFSSSKTEVYKQIFVDLEKVYKKGNC